MATNARAWACQRERQRETALSALTVSAFAVFASFVVAFAYSAFAVFASFAAAFALCASVVSALLNRKETDRAYARLPSHAHTVADVRVIERKKARQTHSPTAQRET